MTKKLFKRSLATAVLLSRVGVAAADDPVELIQARQEVPEHELLDVGILVFDPGLPEDEYERFVAEEKGIFTDVRKSEARYMPNRLKRTLESTGLWGAVRLVPETHAVDVVVHGTILESTGKDLELEIVATDATGREWMKKKYEEEADPLAYGDRGAPREPFQNLYNRIANDLLEERRDRDEDDLAEVRRVSELRFAADLAPVAFESYLKVKKDRYEPAKLPAHGDPMMLRLGEIRERDYMFIDTLNEYYADLFARMQEPYDSWRSFSYEEQVALDELNKAAKWEKILGAAAIVGGIVASQSRNRGGRTAGQVAVLGGMAAMMDGLEKSEEAKMHREGLRELAQSLDADIAPILMEVEGEVLRLSGSAEAQYATWRQLLKRIFATELGLPADPNAGAVAGAQGPSER